MSIGKDSIQKRVAKTTETVETVEAVAETATATETTAPAKKAAPKKASTPKSTAAKKPAAKKPAAPKVDTAVMANVSPETVEKVTGHKENAKVEITQIGGKMPTHLL